jgi:hypothetical protein
MATQSPFLSKSKSKSPFANDSDSGSSSGSISGTETNYNPITFNKPSPYNATEDTKQVSIQDRTSTNFLENASDNKDQETKEVSRTYITPPLNEMPPDFYQGIGKTFNPQKNEDDGVEESKTAIDASPSAIANARTSAIASANASYGSQYANSQRNIERRLRREDNVENPPTNDIDIMNDAITKLENAKKQTELYLPNPTKTGSIPPEAAIKQSPAEMLEAYDKAMKEKQKRLAEISEHEDKDDSDQERKDKYAQERKDKYARERKDKYETRRFNKQKNHLPVPDQQDITESSQNTASMLVHDDDGSSQNTALMLAHDDGSSQNTISPIMQSSNGKIAGVGMTILMSVLIGLTIFIPGYYSRKNSSNK